MTKIKCNINETITARVFRDLTYCCYKRSTSAGRGRIKLGIAQCLYCTYYVRRRLMSERTKLTNIIFCTKAYA